MKKLMMFVVAMLAAASVKAAPYFYVPFVTPGSQLYLSQGALFTPSFGYSQTFTNAAIVYHPVSSGSIIPVEFQKYLPPESWSINFGGGYASATGNTVAGPGISLNLLDSVRSYATEILNASKNARLEALATQIAPGTGPMNITVGPQWATTMVSNGTALPIDKWTLKPYWFIGASYGF